MSRLILNMRGLSSVHPTVYVDGVVLKFKKNEFGSLQATYETDKQEVELVICKYLELSGRLWFLMSMLCFFISLFGIFDSRYDSKCIIIDCKYKMKLNPQNKVTIKFTGAFEGNKAVDIEADCGYEELANKYYVDKKIKRRYKILIGTKILCWISLIAITICVLIVKFK